MGRGSKSNSGNGGEWEEGAKVIEGMESRRGGRGSKSNRGNGGSGSGKREQK